MTKTILSFFLILLIFICLIASPAKAKKRLRLKDLKSCAQESADIPSLLEKFKKAKNYTQSLRKKARRLYDKSISEKNKLDKMPREINEEVDIYNKLVVKYNQQAEQQREAVRIFNNAAQKLNIFKTKLRKKRSEYTKNCTNIYYRRKHIWIVCGKKMYKNTGFCKQK